MDVLSEVLKAVRLNGALFFNGEFSAPWCFRSSQSATVVPYVSPGAKRLILFHFLIEGRACARLPDGKRVDLAAGDIVVLPHGDAHFLGNGLPEKPVDALRVFAKGLTKGLRIVRFGGRGEVTRFVCGFLACEPRLSDVVIAGLPPLLKVRVIESPSDEWLQHAIRYSVDQGNAPNAGSGLVLARIAELLFVETLRRYINTLPPTQTGWLAGVRDPGIGHALALMHGEPDFAWTIESLARRIGMSRTRLAGRFRYFMQESPMAYLAQWRLKLGAEILESTEDSIAEIAIAVGYGSESAFNRAFRRLFGCPPAQFRRDYRAQHSRAASRTRIRKARLSG